MSPWLCGVVLLICLHCTAPSRIYNKEECAIILSSAGAVATGRDVCLKYGDVEEAFSLAKEKVGLRYPARQVTDLTTAHLGTALQETSRILARRFWLSRWEVENALPRLDTSKTDIGRYCAWPLRKSVVPCPQERYRRIDATCNNLLDPTRGAAGLPFKRLLPPLYADRISEPRVGRDGSPLPLPRLVSTRVHADTHKRHDLRVSFMFPAWGQLVDHDLTLTAETKEPDTRKEIDCCAEGVSLHPNCYPLSVPREDPFYKEKKQTCLNLARSLAGVRPGCALGSRVQINLHTAYIDANFIYGSDNKLAESLRLLQKGQLKTFDAFPELGLKPLLPPKTKQPDDVCLRPHPDIYCFLAGDPRVNEQLALGVLHTLAVREHNRIASELSYINPHWDDEKLYQEARHIMAAIVQHITYNEFLPQLLGEKFLKQYDLKLNPEGYNYSYDAEVDATIPASFGTAAFRFGHSLLPDTMQRRSSNHKLSGERKIREMLQQPFDLYKPGWVDAYVLGLVNQVAQPMDHSVTAEVTNHLFQEPARDFGRDLAAINLARAREHGIPGYMAYRKHCGLDDIDSWQDMWSSLPNTTVSEYLQIYDHPDDVDLWSAGVSELPADGSMLGPVFSCIIATTFRDLKKGDRFWYENPGFPSSFTLRQLKEIKKYTLARFICNSGDNIETIQMKVMLLPDYDENPRVSCKSGEIPDINLNFWKETLLYEEDGYKYPEKSHLAPSNLSEGYLPPLIYYPWSSTEEKVPDKDTYPSSFETYTEKEHVPYENDPTENEKGSQFLLNPLNLDELSPPFPDLFVLKDKYALSEETYHGISPVMKEKHENVEEYVKKKPDGHPPKDYGEHSTDLHYEKYPSPDYIPSFDKAPPSNSSYGSDFHIGADQGTSSDETNKYPVINQNNSNDKHQVDTDYYSADDKKFSDKDGEYYPPNYGESEEPLTISTLYLPPKETDSQKTKLEEGYIYDKHVYQTPVDTSLTPPLKKKSDHSSVIKTVSDLIDQYGKENYSFPTEKEIGGSNCNSGGDSYLNKEYFVPKGDCHADNKEDKDIVSITSTPIYVQDTYIITESGDKSDAPHDDNYSLLKPPSEESNDGVAKAKGFDMVVGDSVDDDKNDSESETKEPYNIQTNVIKDKTDKIKT